MGTCVLLPYRGDASIWLPKSCSRASLHKYGQVLVIELFRGAGSLKIGSTWGWKGFKGAGPSGSF